MSHQDAFIDDLLDLFDHLRHKRAAPDTLAGFDVPIFIVSNTKDPSYPPALLNAVHDTLPYALLKRLESAGRSPYWDSPTRSWRVLHALS